MKILRIFVVVEHSLYAVQWEGDGCDSFEALFDRWLDPEFLEDFFEKHKDDLQRGFWGKISVEDAVSKTLDAAEDFERRLLDVAKVNAVTSESSLDSLFTPLSPNDPTFVRLKTKAYGNRGNSWLRVYAVRLGPGLYLITGGALKLTKKMQDRPHTHLELDKLEACVRFLKANGIETGTDLTVLNYLDDEE